MSELNSAENLAAYFKDAAYQRRIMEPWLDDRRFEAAGGKIVYSIDTDVIKLYTNPAEESVSTASSRGYACVFWDDPAELSIALGQLLAEHIFHDLPKNKYPHLIMPPLEREVGRVFAAVARVADREYVGARKEFGELRTIVGELKKQQTNSDLLDELNKRAPRLAEILRGISGPSAELRRFGSLFSQSSIASPDFIMGKLPADSSEIRRVLAPMDNLSELVQFLSMKTSWQKRLKETKHASYENKIEDDAEALGRLEWMNFQLDQKRFRVVHITGDQAIFHAAAEYRFQDNHGPSFSDRYLRHPRAFLGETRGPFGPGTDAEKRSQKDNDVLNMFDVFLGKLPLDGSENIDKLEAVLATRQSDLAASVKPVLEAHPTIVSDFKARWESYIRSVAVRYIPRQLTLADWGLPTDLSGEWDGILNRIEDQLENRVDETWAACFVAVIRTGFDILAFQKDGSSIRARNVSPLYFDSLPNTLRFVQTMLTSQQSGKLKAEEYQRDLDALVLEDKGSRYLYYLAYAFLFAVVGRWHIAVILSERAIRIAKSCGVEKFTGREANYLKAIALRHNAKSVEDLDEVMATLDRAYECLKRDQETRSNLNVWTIRYEIEKVALHLTYYLFDRFLGQKSAASRRMLSEIQSDLEQHLSNVDEITDSWIRRSVERNLLTNWFMAALLRVHGDREDLDMTVSAMLFGRFKANIHSNENPEIETSFLVKSVYLISSWWLEANLTEKKKIRTQVLTMMSDQNIKIASVMPYDSRRFAVLRQIVES